MHETAYSGCYNQVNIKENLDRATAIIVEESCYSRGVDPEYFKSRLVETLTATVVGQVLTITLNMADGSAKQQVVTLP